MKNLFTLIGICFTFGLFAQNDIILKINHKFGQDNFEMGTVVNSYDNYEVKVNRLEYYLNDFIITHDGGQETSMPQHVLIDTESSMSTNLGTHDITNIEKISFSVGVHPDSNHLDPSLYPMAHPLAPKNPSMHWGWTAGYRFVALEGKAGLNTSFVYQIHALGDDNYKSLTIDNVAGIPGNSSLTINLDADYLAMFDNVNVSPGLINHGEFGESITLMENFATKVFYPAGQIPVTTIDPNFEGKFQIQPNPSFDNSTNVILNLPTADNYQLTLTNLMGQVIQTYKVNAGEQNLEISNNHSGVYFIHLWKDGEPVAYEKWIIK